MEGASTSPAPSRVLAIGLALAAAACLIYGAFSRQWLVNGSRFEQYGFGLRSNYTCDADTCDEDSNSNYVDRMREFSTVSARNASSAFAPMGWATFIESLIAAAGLIAAAAVAAARRRPDLPMQPTTIALLAIIFGLITGCIFVATKPGAAGFVGAGISFWIFGAGAVLGIAGAQLLAKVNRPLDPDLMADTMNPDQF